MAAVFVPQFHLFFNNPNEERHQPGEHTLWQHLGHYARAVGDSKTSDAHPEGSRRKLAVSIWKCYIICFAMFSILLALTATIIAAYLIKRYYMIDG